MGVQILCDVIRKPPPEQNRLGWGTRMIPCLGHPPIMWLAAAQSAVSGGAAGIERARSYGGYIVGPGVPRCAGSVRRAAFRFRCWSPLMH